MSYTSVALASQFGMPLYGISGLLPFTGSQFWVNEGTGSDGNTGGPQDPLKTLSQALAFCTAGNNDVVFLTGTVHVTATVAWNKNNTHLIGLAPELSNQQGALITTTGTSVFTPLVNVTATGCIFKNIGSLHGFANASAQICWTDGGGLNQYQGCLFGGMNNATAAAQAGSRSLLVTGATGNNTFTNCTIGLDTVVRATGTNASLEFTASSPRNVFRGCIFAANVSNTADIHITVGAAGISIYAYFDNCLFMNAIESSAATMAVAIIANASAGGAIILQNPISFGATLLATTGPVYVVGTVPVATTSGLAVKAT